MRGDDNESVRLGDFLEMVSKALEGVAEPRAPAAGLGLKLGRASLDVPVRVAVKGQDGEQQEPRVLVAVPGAAEGSVRGRIGRIRLMLGEDGCLTTG